MTTSTQWQLAHDSAERYQSILTPTILGPFAEALVDFAALRSAARVVDVGCGTGAAARVAAGIVGASGAVTGVDVNAGMIAVARTLPAVPGAPIEWLEASATGMPLDDQSVDAALCAQTLQFLPDRLRSLAEMRRVLKPGGQMSLSLWCAIEQSPYFCVLVEAIARHISPGTSAGLHAAFALSDPKEIHALVEKAGFEHIEMSVVQLNLQLPTLNEFIPRHISATPMAVGFNGASESVQEAVIQEVIEKLSSFTKNDHVQIPFKSHMISGRK